MQLLQSPRVIAARRLAAVPFYLFAAVFAIGAAFIAGEEWIG